MGRWGKLAGLLVGLSQRSLWSKLLPHFSEEYHKTWNHYDLPSYLIDALSLHSLLCLVP